MPFKPDQREYRSFTAPLTAADGDEDSFIVEGYATTFDDPYDFGPEGCKECISRSALDGADMSDVIFQVDHQGTPLARQSNGSLSIAPDEHGLHIRADLSGCRAAREAFESIKNGLLCCMSWGFTIAQQGWSWDEQKRTSTIDRIKKVFDVSAVTFPANPATEINARSYLDGVIEAERRESAQRDRERRQRAALKLRLL